MNTVHEYLQEARHDRRLRRTTHHYISDMIEYFGRPKVFEGIYGMEKQMDAIDAFFRAHSMSMERRLLLLVGPQGSGKSMTVDHLKRKLEEYSHTADGAVYAVQGCPFHQHPFDLVPLDVRDDSGVQWHEEAVPCPVCDQLVRRTGGWKQMPVERVYVSARDKIGVAKHTPTDLRREDITNFVGNINFAMLKERGSTYDPGAYDFEGKIIWANRGILDWTEVFKSRRQLLSLLLELIQSKRIDLANFPTVHVDEVVIGHSNYPEYQVFVSVDIIAAEVERTFEHQSMKDLNLKDLLKQFEETKVEFINKKIDLIVEEVVPTHFYDYGQNLYLNYLEAAARNVAGEPLSATEKELVDEVEGIMVTKRQISRQGRVAFENVLLERKDDMLRMSYKDNEHLSPVINEIVFNKIKNLLRLYEKSEELDAKSQELLKVLYRSAIEQYKYCDVCARSLFKVIGRSF